MYSTSSGKMVTIVTFVENLKSTFILGGMILNLFATGSFLKYLLIMVEIVIFDSTISYPTHFRESSANGRGSLQGSSEPYLR
jgi:hypothetical protein